MSSLHVGAKKQKTNPGIWFVGTGQYEETVTVGISKFRAISAIMHYLGQRRASKRYVIKSQGKDAHFERAPYEIRYD